MCINDDRPNKEQIVDLRRLRKVFYPFLSLYLKKKSFDLYCINDLIPTRKFNLFILLPPLILKFFFFSFNPFSSVTIMISFPSKTLGRSNHYFLILLNGLSHDRVVSTFLTISTFLRISCRSEFISKMSIPFSHRPFLVSET